MGLTDPTDLVPVEPEAAEALVVAERGGQELYALGGDAVLLEVEALQGAVHDERVREEGARLRVEDRVGEADLADRGVELYHLRQRRRADLEDSRQINRL